MDSNDFGIGVPIAVRRVVDLATQYGVLRHQSSTDSALTELQEQIQSQVELMTVAEIRMLRRIGAMIATVAEVK